MKIMGARFIFLRSKINRRLLGWPFYPRKADMKGTVKLRGIHSKSKLLEAFEASTHIFYLAQMLSRSASALEDTHGNEEKKMFNK